MIANWFNAFDDCDYVVREIMRHYDVDHITIQRSGVVLNFPNGRRFVCAIWWTRGAILDEFAHLFEGVSYDSDQLKLVATHADQPIR